ncbi:unnamed protein product [Soboliphyme baturini]|uniref:G-protein coupled receptors family 1 profile domain-containing protein n=1 Tax=Soboliphyme baturini TaxID=241478 RepID=A0A183J859_9BILA|nr:unnamed protein product [Soboliphyme baturini]
MAYVWIIFCIIDLYLASLSSRKHPFLLSIGFFIVNVHFVIILTVGIRLSKAMVVFCSLLFVIVMEMSLLTVALLAIIFASLSKENNLGFTVEELASYFAVGIVELVYLIWMNIVLYECYQFMCYIKPDFTNTRSTGTVRSYASYQSMNHVLAAFPI